MGLALMVAVLLNDSVNVTVTTSPYEKGGSPPVNIDIIEPVAGFRLVLQRDDGEKLDVKGGGRPGQKGAIQLAHPEGKFSGEGELAVHNPDRSSRALPLVSEASGSWAL